MKALILRLALYLTERARAREHHAQQFTALSHRSARLCDEHHAQQSYLRWRDWLVTAWMLLAVCSQGQTRIVVHADHPGPEINPAMWGIFFEDINFGADGGLYAELVKNRGFEFPEPLMGWTIAGEAAIGRDPARTNNEHFLTLTAAAGMSATACNEGFRGMGVRQGESYDFSVQARSPRVKEFQLELVDPADRVLGTATVKGIGPEWDKLSTTIKATGTEAKARLRLRFAGEGRLDIDCVSLFPRHTWKNRPGGLRADLAQALAELKPGFMRFPGGCIVEGRYLTNRYQWKTTIGAPDNRKLIINRWNDEFRHRPTPDYFQSFGLGFFEFFQLCEDIGAQPLPILNCGMACQFNSGELAENLDPYIQDALDLVEFANGPVTSAWGAQRAAMGHPSPFKLKMMGVGNEQWGEQYIARYARFASVLKARHPEILLVSSAGPGPADDKFFYAWPKLRELKADIVDEHCYAAPKWFLENANRYNLYDRNGPKVFMGEYAAQSVAIASPLNRNNLECALAEAAYMTGLERNADVVRLSSYAPLFGHVDGWQWTPNLIWCDNLAVYGTPNYYVQQLFSLNRGDYVLPTTGSEIAGIYTSACKDRKSGEIILKVVNPMAHLITTDITLEGASKKPVSAKAITLAGSSPADGNSLQEPRKVAPVTTSFNVEPGFSYSFKPYSFTVLRLR